MTKFLDYCGRVGGQKVVVVGNAALLKMPRPDHADVRYEGEILVGKRGGANFIPLKATAHCAVTNPWAHAGEASLSNVLQQLVDSFEVGRSKLHLHRLVAPTLT